MSSPTAEPTSTAPVATSAQGTRLVVSAKAVAAPALAAAALVLDVFALLLLLPQPAAVVNSMDGSTIGGYVLGATYPIVGWIIASRRPGNAIGWVFLAIGLSQALDTFAAAPVAYLTVTSALVALFAGLVVVLQAALAPFTRTNSIAVATSTLAAAASFQPLLRRVRRVVDRRFNRAGFDADREAAGFGGQIRDQVDVRSVTDALTAALGRTIEPSSAGVWLREPPR